MHGKQEIRTGWIDAKTRDRVTLPTYLHLTWLLAGIGPRLELLFHSVQSGTTDLLLCSVGRNGMVHSALRLLAHLGARPFLLNSRKER
jgi:hypothetical protein